MDEGSTDTPIDRISQILGTIEIHQKLINKTLNLPESNIN
jgi:hypothetical protein